MATKKTILINGKEYPCFKTLAANFDFKDVTGKEATQIDPKSLTDIIVYMWATIKGACKRLEMEFPFDSPHELAVYLDDDHIVEWTNIINAKPEGKKK